MAHPPSAVSDSLPPPKTDAFDASQIERPDAALLRYYLLCSLASGPFFPVALLPLLARYFTLRYRFDDDGIAMRWGVLFRREIYLTYRRIQDIHLNRNLIQRWFGLATVAVQTASGSAMPEMSIEGILEAEALRDYLYERMRGASEPSEEGADAAISLDPPAANGRDDEALSLLMEIRDALRSVTTASERGKSDE